jgi:parallel beta-helix repeat protein
MVATMLLLVLLNSQPSDSEATAFVDHRPIRIDNELGFTSSNGVTGGNGSSENPFLISGWRIVNLSSSDSIAIVIGNTTSHALVYNVGITGTTTGLRIINASNVIVSDSVFTNNTWAVAIDYSTNCKVVNNTFTDNHYAVFVFRSENIEVKNNIYLRNEFDSSLELPSWVVSFFSALAVLAAVILLVLLPLALKTNFFRRQKLLRVVARVLSCVLVQSVVILVVTGFLLERMNTNRMDYGAGLAISLMTVILGLAAIIFLSLYKSRWIEPQLR